MSKVLITTSTFSKVSPEPSEMLTNAGYEFQTNPFGRALTKDETVELAKGCVGVIAGTEAWDREVIDRCPSIEVISRVGVGMDNVDIDYAESKGLVIRNTPYGPTRAVSEITLALTMSLLRKIPQSHFKLRQGTWKKENGSLLQGKKVGILGLGKIGKETATLFKALGNDVSAYDLYFDDEWASEHGVEKLSMDELLKTSDILILHLPGTKEPVISDKQFDLMKKGAYLINVSRGGVVEEAPMIEALQNGKLTGAAIDVFSKEPYTEGPILELENVVVTPHIGSYAAESKLQMEIDAVNNLLEALK